MLFPSPTDPTKGVDFGHLRYFYPSNREAINAIPHLTLPQSRALALNALWNDPNKDPELLMKLSSDLYGTKGTALPIMRPYTLIEEQVLLAFRSYSAERALTAAKSAWTFLLNKHENLPPLEFPYEEPTSGIVLPNLFGPCLTALPSVRVGTNRRYVFYCSRTGNEFERTAHATDLSKVLCPHCRTLNNLQEQPKAERPPKHLGKTYGCMQSTGKWEKSLPENYYEVVCLNTGIQSLVRANTFRNNPGHCRHCKTKK